MKTATLLLGAEGCSELGLNTPAQPDWIRAATTDEVLEAFTPQGLDDLSIDHNGRPYWAVTVLDSAPRDVWERAQRLKRCLRLVQ